MWTNLHPSEVSKKRRNQIIQRGPDVPRALNVILPVWKGDQDQAIRLLEWSAQMGKTQAPFWLLCDAECDKDYLMDLAQKAFSVVQWIEDRERIKSNWHEQGDHQKSAAGPNSLFRQAAWHFYVPKLGPWLWIEPDCAFCIPDWYDKIQREYQICRKPFMGFRVTPQNHPGVPQHMSGIGVYSQETIELAPDGVNSGEVAFDIGGVNQFLPNAHNTDLIYHKYRAPSFTSQEDFDARVDRNVAIWHACKDGSIYPFLRKRLGISSPIHVRETQSAEPLPSKQIVVGSSPITHSNTDIFIKTRDHDLPWLQWCVRSIDKFASGFRKRTIITDFGDTDIRTYQDTFTGSCPIPLAAKGPGYLWQQVCKLHADEHTDAEWILYMDSDCVFTRPVSPEDFIRNGKPVWLYTPLDQARPDQHQWLPIMEKFLGKKPEHEFMRRHPFIVQRWMLEEFRKFTQYRHGKSLKEYIMEQADPANPLALRFSEWNCLGFFLWEHHRDKVDWTLDIHAGAACVYQGFTHGGEGRKHEDIAKFQEILDGSTAFHGMAKAEEVHLPPPLTIESAIAFLASQVRDNFHKARIVRDLKKAWKGKGEAPKTRTKAISEQPQAINGKKKDRILLCIHSYPGGNEALERHWPQFCEFGADRIVGIGTTDNKCAFPCQSINIGENSYMKLKGNDDHLCRRLLDTVKWCLTQPEDKFAILEYDTLVLKRMPSWKGISAHLTGGKVNGSIATQFFHNPWLFDRESGPALVEAMEKVLPDSLTYPNNSPDLFLGLACERSGIKVGCNFKMFTRNSLDANGDLELAVEAALEGAHVIHGVKQEWEYNTIMAALNEQEVALSHAQ